MARYADLGPLDFQYFGMEFWGVGLWDWNGSLLNGAFRKQALLNQAPMSQALLKQALMSQAILKQALLHQALPNGSVIAVS